MGDELAESRGSFVTLSPPKSQNLGPVSTRCCYQLAESRPLDGLALLLLSLSPVASFNPSRAGACLGGRTACAPRSSSPQAVSYADLPSLLLADGILESVSEQASALKDSADALKDTVTALPDSVQDAVSAQADAVKDTISSQADAVKGAISSQADAVKDALSSQADALSDSFNAQADALKSQVSEQAQATLDGILSPAAWGLKQEQVDSFNANVDGVKRTVGPVAEKAGPVLVFLGDGALSLGQLLLQKTQEYAPIVGQAALDLGGKAVEAAQVAGSEISKDIVETLDAQGAAPAIGENVDALDGTSIGQTGASNTILDKVVDAVDQAWGRTLRAQARSELAWLDSWVRD